MRKPSTALLLLSTLILGACTPATQRTIGGVGLNPCAYDGSPWQDRGYCGATSLNVSSPVKQSAKQRLHLSSLVNGQLAFNQGQIPLQAQAFLAQDGLPEGAFVEFYADGQLIGSASPDVLGNVQLLDPSFSLIWKDLLAEGIHTFQARLKAKDGTLLAESNTVQISLKKRALNAQQDAVDLLGPAGHLSVPVNASVNLRSLAQISQRSKELGGKVQFVLRNEDGRVIRRFDATEADAAFGGKLDLTGLPTGTYTLQSQIVDSQGKLLADSNTIELHIGNPAVESTLNLDLLTSEDQVLPNTKVPLNATLDLAKEDASRAKTIRFYTLAPDGTRTLISQGPVNGEGHYNVDWDTSGFAPGTYQLLAQIFDSAGQLMQSSNLDQITILGNPDATGQNTIGLLKLPGTVKPGQELTLRGTPVITPQQAQAGVSVRFKITKPDGTSFDVPGVKQPNGTYAADLSTQNLPSGQYRVQSQLFDKSGKLLSSSNTETFTLGNTKIELAPPVASTFPGDILSLRATPTLTPEQRNAGVSVTFEVRDTQGQLITTLNGTQQPDGSFKADWNTSGLSPALYDIQAVLKDSQGNTLDSSNIGQTRLNTQVSHRIDLTSDNLNVQSPNGSGTLKAKPTLAQGLSAEQVDVFFEIQGPNGPVTLPATRQPDGTYTANVSGSQLPIGSYPYVSILKDRSGKTLAQSSQATLTLSNAAQNTITLAQNSQNITANLGQTVPIAAQVTLTSEQAQQGVVVEFYVDGQKIGTGVKQPDGSYSTQFDTSVKNLGQFPIEAVLKSPEGTELSRSTLGQLTLTQSVLNNNRVTLTPPLNSGSAAVGSTVTLQAKVQLDNTLNPGDVVVEFRDETGQVLATGNVDNNGNVSATWFNAGPVGDHTVTAVLKPRNSSTPLASSNSEPARLYSPNTSTGGSGGGSNTSGPQITLTDPNLIVLPGDTVAIFGNISSPPGNTIGENFFPTVEIFANGTSIGLAQINNNGSYSLNWNTTGQVPGTVQLVAQLKEGTSHFGNSNLGSVTFIQNAIDTEIPGAGNPTYLRTANQIFQSTVPTLTTQQTNNGATVFFEILDAGGNLALAPIPGTQITTAGADQNKWRTATADLSGLLADSNYTVRAVIRSNNSNYGTVGAVPPAASTYIALDTTPVPFNTNSPTLNLTGPANNSNHVVGATLALTSTSTNLPPGATVRFTVRNAANAVVFQGDGTAGVGNSFSANWNTDGIDIGAYTVLVEALETNGNAYLNSGPNTVNLNFAPAGTLTVPADESLFYQEQGPITMTFIPKDDQGNPVSANQMAGLSVEFIDNDAIGEQSLGTTGTRNPDGSYTLNWNIAVGQETTGNHIVKAVVKNGGGNVLYTSPENDVRLFPYPQTVFIVDGDEREVFDTYTGPPINSVNPKIPSLPTGQRKLMFSTSFKTVALAKHPNNGNFYYIEEGSGGGNKRFARYNPSTKTETIISNTLNPPSSQIRLAYDPATLQLYASGGQKIFRVNDTTGAFTELTLSFPGGNQATFNSNTSSGDIAFAPGGVMYMVSNKKAFRINVAGNAADVFLAGDLTGISGNSTSNGFDDDRHGNGKPASMLLMDTSGKFWRFGLDATTGNLTGTKTQLATYAQHNNGDMTSGHVLP